MPDDSRALPTSVLMFISARYAETQVNAALHEAGFEDLTQAQSRVAARVGEGGTRLTDLAEQAQITKQSAGALVDQLQANGYLERVPDPSDARARLIRLAARGRRAQAAAREAEATVEATYEAHLGKVRMTQLRQALEDLREITDPWA